jgi:hypothetical protein
MTVIDMTEIERLMCDWRTKHMMFVDGETTRESAVTAYVRLTKAIEQINLLDSAATHYSPLRDN